MKNKFLKGIALLMLATTTLVSCSTDQQDTTTTTNVREFETKSNVTNFDTLLRNLYGSSYSVGSPFQVRDATNTYTLKHVTTPAGLEGYIVQSSTDNVYVQHDRVMKTISDYTNDSGRPEGIYNASQDSYYLDHGFSPILVQDPGAPAPVIYGKKYTYGACAKGVNGKYFAGVYLQKKSFGTTSSTPVQDSNGRNVTVLCSGNPMSPEPYNP